MHPSKELQAALDRIGRSMAPYLADLQRERNAHEADRAKANPRDHKLTLVFEGKGATNYRYVRAGKDGRGREVRFCWSSHRNAAGYFLTWREVRSAHQGKRDQWAARKVRKRAMELAERRAARFRERQAEARACPMCGAATWDRKGGALGRGACATCGAEEVEERREERDGE